MSDETPSVEEIKDRLKIEVEEEPTKADASPDVVAELQNLGRQFANTLQSAWNSEERQRIEGEVREGMKSFVNEVDKVFQTAKDSSTAERLKSEASNVTNKVGTSDVGTKARSGIVQGLKWMSIELEKLADKFTSPEKESESSEDTAES